MNNPAFPYAKTAAYRRGASQRQGKSGGQCGGINTYILCPVTTRLRATARNIIWRLIVRPS